MTLLSLVVEWQGQQRLCLPRRVQRNKVKTLRIAILERADYDHRGGNSRWTASYMRMKNLDEMADNFVEDMMAFSDNYSDREYIETLAENAGSTLRWVEEKGVDFDYLPTMFLTASKPRLLTRWRWSCHR